MKFNTLTRIFLAASLIALTAGTVAALHIRSVQQEDAAILQVGDKFAADISAEGGVSKAEALRALLAAEHMARRHSISDQEFGVLLSTIEAAFAANKSGDALVDFGAGFHNRQNATESQKEKIGTLCLDVAQKATSDTSRMYALAIILHMRITSVRSALAPLTIDRNREVAAMARQVTVRLASAATNGPA